MTKTNLFFFVVSAIIILVGTVSAENAIAQGNSDTDKGNSVKAQVDENTESIDSFFDVFFKIAQHFNVDSFFDVFIELEDTDNELQSQVDDNAATIETEIIALELRSNQALNSHNTDPEAHDSRISNLEDMSNDHWDRIAVLEGQIADLEARIAVLETGGPTPCDPNGNGEITGTELADYLNSFIGDGGDSDPFPFPFPFPSPSPGPSTITPADGDAAIMDIETSLGDSSNGNGVIDTPEELAALNTLMGTAFPEIPLCTISGISGEGTLPSGIPTPCDPNGNGEITGTELADHLNSFIGDGGDSDPFPFPFPFPSPGPSTMTPADGDAAIMEIETSLGDSSNGNGVIDTPEELAALNTLMGTTVPDIPLCTTAGDGSPPPSGATVCDPNGDGTIDVLELVSISGMDIATATSTILHIEATLSTSNTNGVIDTPSEIGVLNTALEIFFGISITCTITGVTPTTCDQNSDGSITAEELVEFAVAVTNAPTTIEVANTAISNAEATASDSNSNGVIDTPGELTELNAATGLMLCTL